MRGKGVQSKAKLGGETTHAGANTPPGPEPLVLPSGMHQLHSRLAGNRHTLGLARRAQGEEIHRIVVLGRGLA